MSEISERSFAQIEKADLLSSARCALGCLDLVYDGAPVAGKYRNRLLLLGFAQGGALHYLDERTGLKDIDVWAFYKGCLERPFPVRARWTADFGPSKFGKAPDDLAFLGRRLDILGRSIETLPEDDLTAPVSRWLNGSAKSAHMLRQKAVIAIYPYRLLGQKLI